MISKFGIGQSVSRVEDPRLLSGKGNFTGDISYSNQAYMYVLRSNHAAAKILSIDISEALEEDGILCVFTSKDLENENIGHLKTGFVTKNKDGSEMNVPTRPALAINEVRHVGEAVAVVVAESIELATRAAEKIVVDYEELPSITNTQKAIDSSSPLVRNNIKNNLCFDWDLGNKEDVDKAFEKSTKIVKLDLVNNRLVPNPMEGRGANALYDKTTDTFSIHCSSQGVHSLKRNLVEIFNTSDEKMNVYTGDVGGGFGMKIFNYPEYIHALFASKICGRPVKWVADRSESFISDTHGRDHVSNAELALNSNNEFLAIKVTTIANLGAYLSSFGIFIPTVAGTAMLAGCYKTPAMYVNVKGVFTNTTPVDAYRGAGRPEASFLIERLVDKAGRETGLGPIEIRKINFISKDNMPFTTALGHTYDSGNFEKNMDDAVKISKWSEFKSRKLKSREIGKLRGIGLSSYIEACSGGGPETANISIDSKGIVTLFIGTQSNGQGHATAYSQIISEQLKIPLNNIKVIQGDTTLIKSGGGTGGSRSIPVGGVATSEASKLILEKAKGIASKMFDVPISEIHLADDGFYTVQGTNKSADLQEISTQASELDIKLESKAKWAPPTFTFPNGCHICEIELDPKTGLVEIKKYTVVDDFGTVINPKLLAGQVHGGIVQGIGQALFERTVYDEDTGQLLTGSFMDYALPRASDVPNFNFSYNVERCKTNSLGIKGAGEAGAIGAPPAVINALINALNVEHIDMPATSELLWRLYENKKNTYQD